ncbi:hypothetical protein M3Y94_00856300 [Aphelenchoides besseyi]|nr:hypothetical protein M3Y94_00856300 [Aphelenchoides besseyi]KAI6226783.1 hypothetical protein M3Y95_00657300 [Aphelenchoides besseyi]
MGPDMLQKLGSTMTLQWTVIALILYVEIAVLLALLFPWIRAHHWKKLFNSRIIHAISRFTTIYQYAIIAVLLLLFLDAVREVRKYSEADIALEHRRALESDSIVHMRLFRAQRNLYISGFALLLFLVISRIVSLISRIANLQSATDAAIRQAEGASRAAKTLLESDDGVEVLKKATEETEKLKKDLRTAEADRDAMKKQTEHLQEEYDRVCTLLGKAERKAGGDKKDD